MSVVDNEQAVSWVIHNAVEAVKEESMGQLPKIIVIRLKSESKTDVVWEIDEKADVVPGSDFRDCRNELCLRCGQYKTKHLGSCDGCRWRH